MSECSRWQQHASLHSLGTELVLRDIDAGLEQDCKDLLSVFISSVLDKATQIDGSVGRYAGYAVILAVARQR